MTRNPFAVAAPSIAALLLLLGAPAALTAADLSRYRDFQLGADLASVTKRVGSDRSYARLIHRRPALIEELSWRPRPLGWSSSAESVNEVVFSFLGGLLFRVAVEYDGHAIEGLTADDMVEAVSASYGQPSRLASRASSPADRYSDIIEVVAVWEDASHRFELTQSSQSPVYRLRGVLKSLDAAARTAAAEALRLEELEAPLRDAAKALDEAAAARAKLSRARLENKPKFRP